MSKTLTPVILEISIGRHFGRQWKPKVSSAEKALELIDAKRPWLLNWIRKKLNPYTRYRIIVDKKHQKDIFWEGKTSHDFSGPVNTEIQGASFPLIYSTVPTDSHAISTAMTIK